MKEVAVYTPVHISAESALAWVNQAFLEANKMNITIGACVVDGSGRVKAKIIMDGANIITDELVERKAKTSLLGLSSHDLALAVEGNAAVLASMTNLGQLTLMGGGFPIIVAGEVVGGFAIGGASVEQDIRCAETVMAYFA